VPEVEARLSALPTIRPLRDSRELADLEIADGLGAFCGYSRRSAEIVRETLGKSLRVPGGEVFAATWGRTLGAYLLLVPSGPDQPWGRLNDQRIQEIGVEVARGCRSRGVAQSLFGDAFSRPLVEARIYVATGYVWCWDVDQSGLSATVYSERLLRLFERFGFRREWTNEPNVMMEPANFLAVRIGGEVPADLLRRFRLSERGERAA
jgi:hypothetical protein